MVLNKTNARRDFLQRSKKCGFKVDGGIMSDQGLSQSNVKSSEIIGVVKWFNGSKGFGFVTPKDGSPDIFLHLTILKQSGFDLVSPGMTIRAEVAEGPKGLQAVSVIDVDKSTASAGLEQNTSRFKWAQETSDLEPECDFILGTVKWFNPSKGYGFVSPKNDTSLDVFVHMVTLRRSGISDLDTGVEIEFRYGEGMKGKQATHVRLPSI